MEKYWSYLIGIDGNIITENYTSTVPDGYIVSDIRRDATKEQYINGVWVEKVQESQDLYVFSGNDTAFL